VSAGNNQTVCAGGSVTLCASGAVSYLWTTGATTSCITVSPTASSTYSVIGTDALGCYDTAAVTVTVSGGPLAATSSTPATCGVFDGTATVNATGGTPPYSYLWNTGNTTQTVTGLFSGTYSVCVTDGYGCVTCDTVSVGSTTTNLQTIFTGGNGQDGNMFDVTALSTIQIVSMDGNLDDAASSGAGGNMLIYYKAGTHVGFETNQSAWTLAGTAFVNPSGTGIPTPIPIALNITISAGQTYAFYVTGDNSGCDVDYTNGTNFGSPAAADANLQILEGIGKAYPFGTNYPSTGPPGSRIWNGRIHYCTGPVGIENVLSTGLSVYPNPSSGTFTISGLPADSKIKVMNLFGEVVFEQKAVSADEVIRLDQPAGIYIYSVSDESGNTGTGKIVIE
ncbi:MAG: T9SS type A sorting domain-containing protein, partial [Bacteroidota bacterium]